MGKVGPVEAGGFYLENGLPDEYYAFTGGELSLTVERGGGINTLCVLDILEHDGKLYPDRCHTPAVVRKEWNRCGKRILYGPGIQFISTHVTPGGRRHRNLFHFPERMELYPFGFRSESDRFGHPMEYDLCIDGRSVVFRFANTFPTRDRLVVTINKDHLVSGTMTSIKSQFCQWSVPDELADAESFRKGPFPDSQEFTLNWESAGADEESGTFCMDGHLKFATGEKGAAVVIAASRPLALRETKTRYFLSVPWEKEGRTDEIRLCLAIGEDRVAALAQARRGVDNAPDIIRRKVNEAVSYARRSPRIRIDSLPPATEFARTVGAFVRAMILAETDTEACIRAAAHKFGFYGDWDQISPARAFQIMGDYETGRKLLRYMLTLPCVDPHFWVTTHMIIAVDDMVACSGDREFLREAYPVLKRIFTVAAAAADPRNGLLTLPFTSGADDPSEVGVEGLIWPSCINAWWYGACRSMENFAVLMGDAGVRDTAREIGDRMAACYMDVFFDEERGTLHTAVDPATGRGTGAYQDVATLGMDYPYGKYLLRSRLREIAEYQAYALCHPAGRTMVAYDEESHEMLKNTIMFHDFGHETKAARAAGLGDEAIRMAGTHMRLFDRCKVAVEAHNISGSDGDISQRADWFAFGASVALDTLIESVIGIQWDMGGLTYAPCDTPGDMTLEGFPYRNAVWNVTVTGEGRYVERIEVDGKELCGTTRLPAELVEGTGTHSLIIVRSARPFLRPTLIDAPGAAVTGLVSTETELSFTVREEVHTSVEAFCPSRPSASLDGQGIKCEWDEATRVMWCDAVISPGRRLRICL